MSFSDYVFPEKNEMHTVKMPDMVSENTVSEKPQGLDKIDFEKQLEYLFQNLDVIEKKEKWISILAYAMSSDIILRWTNNPVLNVVSYSDNSGNMEVIESKISSNFRYQSYSDQ